MNCKNCNQIINDINAKFCPNCGQSLTDNNNVNTSNVVPPVVNVTNNQINNVQNDLPKVPDINDLAVNVPLNPITPEVTNNIEQPVINNQVVTPVVSEVSEVPQPNVVPNQGDINNDTTPKILSVNDKPKKEVSNKKIIIIVVAVIAAIALIIVAITFLMPNLSKGSIINDVESFQTAAQLAINDPVIREQLPQSENVCLTVDYLNKNNFFTKSLDEGYQGSILFNTNNMQVEYIWFNNKNFIIEGNPTDVSNVDNVKKLGNEKALNNCNNEGTMVLDTPLASKTTIIDEVAAVQKSAKLAFQDPVSNINFQKNEKICFTVEYLKEYNWFEKGLSDGYQGSLLFNTNNMQIEYIWFNNKNFIIEGNPTDVNNVDNVKDLGNEKASNNCNNEGTLLKATNE